MKLNRDDFNKLGSGSIEDSLDTSGRGIGGILTQEESEALQESLGVPVETASEADAEKMKEEARKHLSKTSPTSARRSEGMGGDGALRRALSKFTEPQVDWRRELKKYIGNALSGEEEYFGSRRHVAGGDYITGTRSKYEAVRKCAIAVDVTGSVVGDFQEFLAEVAAIAHAKKINEIHVLPFAESVHDVVVIKGSKKPTPADFEHVRLGGGTENIVAIKNYIKTVLKDSISFCVIITDGYLTAGLPLPPKAAWGSNTIWMIYDNIGFRDRYNFTSKWGKIINVDFKKK